MFVIFVAALMYTAFLRRVKGKRYFDCPPLHGGMVRPDKVKVCTRRHCNLEAVRLWKIYMCRTKSEILL